MTLTVVFAPTAVGSYSGTLAVQSNATNSSLTVGLSGSAAVVVTAHSVTLSWTASTTSVSGYNVYRSTQSGTGYVKLNSSLVTSASYVDTAVSGGVTYYYVITAVTGSGVESAYSSQVSALVPTS
jgi:fibronectin type 3 domain-containing protein